MVDVTHHGDHRGAGHELGLVDLLLELLRLELVLERRRSRRGSPSSDPRIWRASSDSDVVAVTISPAMNRIFTISAGDRLVFSAKICGVEPRTTCRTGPAGRLGDGGRRRDRRGAPARVQLVQRRVPRRRRPVALPRRARPPLRGGLRLRFGLRARLRRRLHHLAGLGGLRHLAAGGAEPGHEVFGHAGGGGLPRHAHLLERLQQFLAGHAELLRELVDPHVACNASSMSLLSLASSSSANPTRSALASAPRRRPRRPRIPAPGGRTRLVRAPSRAGRRGRLRADPDDPEQLSLRRALPTSDARPLRLRPATGHHSPGRRLRGRGLHRASAGSDCDRLGRACRRPRPTVATGSLAARVRDRASSAAGATSSGLGWASSAAGCLGGLLDDGGGDRRRGRRRLGGLALRLDVDPPPGQPRREPGVLSLPADRERELVVGHDHERGLRLGVDRHLSDLRGLQGVRDERRRTRRTTAPRRSSRRGAR